MQKEKVIIIGAGPCGLSAAIELQQAGIDPLLIEKGNVVNSIYQYPTHQTFFSSSERLEVGGMPFVTEMKKPVRNQALAYYRTVAQRRDLRIHTFERVMQVTGEAGNFTVSTKTIKDEENKYQADFVIVATGYYDQPYLMQVPGEELPHVFHYFKEAHPYFGKNVTVIGGKNSAVDAVLELHKAGANITALYRGSTYSKSVKPWILPEYESLARNGYIDHRFNAHIKEITETQVIFEENGETHAVEADFVFAMTGYRPDLHLLQGMGINIHPETGKPDYHPETMESNIPGIYIAGVIAAGNNNNEVFIENGRFHGGKIAASIATRS
ncbi:thioredoxin reductase (NADPH) [Terribacillus aidingensis]|uniref:Thioredoxin reductase (NADPH) n=1 Tax=Terribacillus aidingensis TaxID=586416 RepID=A0A285NMF1_9BACI|nr:YpdA family putative bacillithiol disulfide reductase [Terribacillus aidingensis]SNZ10408.1 thioredoxin reductase (NADPH) [Terribacillus aidingensis]